MAQVKISSAKDLQAWLADKPPVWASMVATRIALRVLPLTLNADRHDRKNLMLQAFRATFIAWTMRMHGNYAQDPAAAHAAAKAYANAYAIADTTRADVTLTPAAYDAALAAAYAAAAAAADDETAHNAAADAALAAAYAAAAYDDETAHNAPADAAHNAAAAAIWASIAADIRWLDSHKMANRFIRLPLWLIDVRGSGDLVANFPPWARKPFDEFDQSRTVKHGPWGVWLTWYRAILPNTSNQKTTDPFGAPNDITIASKETEFWQRDADVVTAEVADIVAGKTPDTRSGRPGSVALKKKRAAPKRSLSRLQRKRSPRPEKQQPPESVEPQSDEPTSDDQLGRRPFAQALVERLDRVYVKESGDYGFAAHIHAPWGAGKTSILLMMREVMTKPGRKAADKPAPHWVVVEFNAWKHMRRNPPWWPLMEEVKHACLQRLSGRGDGWRAFLKRMWFGGYKMGSRAALLQTRWAWWKLRTDALPYVLAICVAGLLGYLFWSSSGTTETILKVAAAGAAAFVAFLGASRVALFGSADSAKYYEAIAQDPLKRITRLFGTIAEKTGAPICIFIDDLDRCPSDYVVDLLEGIQTSFRHKNVAYVVAADRNWIKASFEKRYGTFSDAVGNMGQPLGYLFLEKIFQVSTPIPGMGDATRFLYWNGLLKGAVPRPDGPPATGAPGADTSVAHAANEAFDHDVESKRESIRDAHGEDLTREQAEAILKESDTEADRAAVLLQLNVSRTAEREAEHLLSKFTGVLPDNPRVMKRMVNAFAMRQAIGIVERNDAPTSVLARWTILEQRYPALADLLIDHPEWVKMFSGKITAKKRKELPTPLQPFADSEAIREIVGASERDRLDAEHVRAITRGSTT